MLERAFRALSRVPRVLPLVGAIALSGCADLGQEMVAAYPPTMMVVSEQNLQLRLLPGPTDRVSVAVYDLPDLTGQYKERENVQSLSRAVSQGGGSLLIKALQDAGERRWFTVLDRTNLDNLLRERQIVTEMRRLYRNETTPDPSVIPPLRHAGILIQGAIVGYDTNTETGGYGARYLGIGGDKKWKIDVVTVNLQAVATGSGEVLASVMVQKPIASSSLQGGIFRYVELDKLLEVEAGVAANEPKQLALQMAVEKAVYSLVLEGAEIGLWQFADTSAGNQLITQHRTEKYRGAEPGTVIRSQARPDTMNASRVVATRPRARQRVSVPAARQRVLPPSAQPPQQSAPPAPPAAGEGEVIG